MSPRCRHCGERIRRVRHPGGKLENSAQYRNRQYCCRRCRDEASAFPIRPWMREYLQAFDRYLGTGAPVELAVMSSVFENRPRRTT